MALRRKVDPINPMVLYNSIDMAEKACAMALDQQFHVEQEDAES
jgi:hypothetical protein